MGWIRFERGRPTRAGFVAGALLAAAPAALPALLLGGWAWPVAIIAAGLLGAFTIRPSMAAA